MTSDSPEAHSVAGPLGSRGPRLLMDGLYLRFNPADVNVGVSYGAGETVIGGVLHFRGFTPETGAIVNCCFMSDEDVEEGHVVIERMPPLPDEVPSPRRRGWKFWRR